VARPGSNWLVTTRQIRNFSSGSGWPQPDELTRLTRLIHRVLWPLFRGTEVLAAGTPANEPRGLVTIAERKDILRSVEGGWPVKRELPAAKAVKNVVLASLVLCMILILLSAAGSETPQKELAKRPRL